MIRIDERRYPTWDGDMTMCPSQRYCYFEGDGKKYCIYLRWRHDDPWTAEIVPVDRECEFIYDVDWHWIETRFYSHDRYDRLQEDCVKYVENMFDEIKWLSKGYYANGN